MVTLEEARQIVKVETAKIRLAELEKAIDTVKNEVAEANTVEDLVKVMGRYVAKVNNARSVLKHSQE